MYDSQNSQYSRFRGNLPNDLANNKNQNNHPFTFTNATEQDQYDFPLENDDLAQERKPPVLETHGSKLFNRSSLTSRSIFQDTPLQRYSIREVGLNHAEENQSINRIPTSPIGIKQTKSSLLLLSDQKSDNCHFSTESSVDGISNHASQNLEEISSKFRNFNIFGSDLKPPSSNRQKNLHMSIGSFHEGFDKNPRKRKQIFPSNSTSARGSTEDQTNLHLQRETVPKYNKTASVNFEKNTFHSDQKPSQKGNNLIHQRARKANNLSTTSNGFQKYFSSFNMKMEDFEPKTWIKQILATDPRKGLKCSCDSNLSLEKSCSHAMKWISKKYKREEFPYLKNTYEKITKKTDLSEPEQLKQIQKDLPRTFPEHKLFAEDSEGIRALDRILNAIAKYDPTVGYVQGMNFIAGALLFHAEEYIAFWLLVSIFEFMEMRDIFLPSLPGLSKHCQIIDMLIFNEEPKIYSKFCQVEIRPEIFCSEWIFTLFSNVIPVANMGTVFDHLFEDGWVFFYKLVLAFLENFEKRICEQEDLVGVVLILKSQNKMTGGGKNSLGLTVNWDKLCQRAQEIQINSQVIFHMHLQFDRNNQWFRTTS